ncbi:MAG: hypothetical protein ABMA25_19405 [Ilumatobacteraceae bacterium]
MTGIVRRVCGIALFALAMSASACGTPSTTAPGERVESGIGAAPERNQPIGSSSTIIVPAITLPPTVPATTAPPTTVPVTAPPTAPPTLPPTLPPPPATQAPQPFVAVPSNSCDPNYSGCVPIADDVDCAGGSGNGPAYVQGPVSVIGEDIYGLDGNDNDGIGCEG